jgi:hypothetical protein
MLSKEEKLKRKKENDRKRRQRIKSWYLKILDTKYCISCGEKSIECLDWHHLDPSKKTNGVSRMVHDKMPIKTILQEMDKCIIVCANCHRKVHANTIYLRMV